jgi:arsenate reductase
MSIKIYHNTKCKTSRDVLEMIRNKGIEPEVIFYLETPPTETELRSLIKKNRRLSARHSSPKRDTL